MPQIHLRAETGKRLLSVFTRAGLAVFMAAFSCSLFAGPAENATEVERIIATGAHGKAPALWFAKDAERKLGSGHANWAATSGGRLASNDAGATDKARQTSFASLSPDRRSCVALSWRETDGRCSFRYRAGSIEEQELTYGEPEIAPITGSRSMFMIAGGRAQDHGTLGLPPIAFDGGLRSQFAIFDAPLPEEIVQRNFVASMRP